MSLHAPEAAVQWPSRSALSNRERAEFCCLGPAGARDNTMVWHAGLLARAVTRGERSLLQVLGEMEAWVNGYVEQIEAPSDYVVKPGDTIYVYERFL